MVDARIILPKDIQFDARAILKCKWGCEEVRGKKTVKCDARNTTLQERMNMIKQYKHALLLHSHDARQLSMTVLEIERQAFLDGYYFAFGVRYCNLCKDCVVNKGEPCPTPKKIRPCEQIFGIDVYKTVRDLGLSINVLKNEDELQNRYGFVFID